MIGVIGVLTFGLVLLYKKGWVFVNFDSFARVNKLDFKLILVTCVLFTSGYFFHPWCWFSCLVLCIWVKSWKPTTWQLTTLPFHCWCGISAWLAFWQLICQIWIHFYCNRFNSNHYKSSVFYTLNIVASHYIISCCQSCPEHKV